MTRTQAFNVADFLASKGYRVTIGVSATIDGLIEYSINGEFAAEGTTAITGFQQLVNDAAQRGLVARIVKLSVTVTDA